VGINKNIIIHLLLNSALEVFLGSLDSVLDKEVISSPSPTETGTYHSVGLKALRNLFDASEFLKELMQRFSYSICVHVLYFILVKEIPKRQVDSE
jgi:hypothetical protein